VGGEGRSIRAEEVKERFEEYGEKRQNVVGRGRKAAQSETVNSKEQSTRLSAKKMGL